MRGSSEPPEPPLDPPLSAHAQHRIYLFISQRDVIIFIDGWGKLTEKHGFVLKGKY